MLPLYRHLQMVFFSNKDDKLHLTTLAFINSVGHLTTHALFLKSRGDSPHCGGLSFMGGGTVKGPQ